jgi:hypothetical protein
VVLPLLHGPAAARRGRPPDRALDAMKRHVSQIRRHCEPGDPMCRPRQRQALLHWAYDKVAALLKVAYDRAEHSFDQASGRRSPIFAR